MTSASGILVWSAAYAMAAICVPLLLRRRKSETSSQFLHTGRNLPLWILSLSYLAANCSALEVLTMIATAAKYGMYAVHFYWLGAIPALVFLMLVMLPMFERMEVRTIPEFFERRFSAGTRALSAVIFCLMMIAIAGLTICIFSRLAHLTIGCSYDAAIWSIACLLSVFLVLGGLTAVIYSEAIQLLLFFVVLVPLTFRLLGELGGVGGLLQRLPASSIHSIVGIPAFSVHGARDGFGLLLGLCLILGFSYWCGDLLLAQRLLAAHDKREMVRTPATALVAKLALPWVLVVPGMAYAAMVHTGATESYDIALPLLLRSHYSAAVFAMAIAALLASLFLGMAGNVAAAVTLLTHDLYRPFFSNGAPDSHYRNCARVFAAALPLMAAGAAYLAFASNSLMEYIQLVLGVLNVPLAITLMMGLLVPRVARRAGTPAIVAGVSAGALHALLAGRVHYGSGMATAFYGAIVTGSATIATALLVSLGAWRLQPDTSTGVFHLARRNVRENPGLVMLSAASLAACCGLYWIFR